MIYKIKRTYYKNEIIIHIRVEAICCCCSFSKAHLYSRNEMTEFKNKMNKKNTILGAFKII